MRGLAEGFVDMRGGVFPWWDELELEAVVFKEVTQTRGELEGVVAIPN